MSTATITAPAAPVAPWTDEDRLRADLAEWIKDRGPKSRFGYDAEHVADLIVANLWGPSLRQMINGDDSPYLWHAVENTCGKAADQDDDEWAAEDNRHGHGPVDGLVGA